MAVTLGLEIFLKKHVNLVRGKRVGLLSHAASLTKDFKLAHEIFFKQRGFNLVKIFAPEHGLFGVAQDMETVADTTDPITGLPVVSLYGTSVETLTPKENDLTDIDVLIIDLQDIGSRYYTFIYTMALCLKVCGRLKIPVIVLDRPNPLNGLVVEGNMLKHNFASFVGLYPLPVRHGMTIGELAMYFNVTENFGAHLTVVAMTGYKRKMYFDETGLTFVPPSPNMPRLETAIVYPGMCLVEATEISEGRGTTMPFEWGGAPFINATKFCEALNKLKLAGIIFREMHFKPGFQKCASQVCHGVQLHVTNRNKFNAYEMGVHFLRTLKNTHPTEFKWRDKPYEFVTDIPAIDLLTGGDEFRSSIDSATQIKKWMQTFAKDTAAFKAKRKPFLLYS